MRVIIPQKKATNPIKSGNWGFKKSQSMSTPRAVLPQDKRASVRITESGHRGVFPEVRDCSAQSWVLSGPERLPLLRPPCPSCPQQHARPSAQNTICLWLCKPERVRPNCSLLVLILRLPASHVAQESAMVLTGVSFFPSMATFHFLLPSCITMMPTEVKSPAGK